jgi:hypothetical protein
MGAGCMDRQRRVGMGLRGRFVKWIRGIMDV